MDNATERPSALATLSLQTNKEQTKVKKRESFKSYCPFCKCQQHYLDSCPEFGKLNIAQRTAWIKDNSQCWKCGRGHEPANCTLNNKEIHKLKQAGYAMKLTPEEAKGTDESWFIPHHLVHHNNKAWVVFNCSYQFRQASLNDQLLSGPLLGPSLLGVLLRF